MAVETIYTDAGNGAKVNWPASPVAGGQYIEGTFHISGEFDKAVIIARCSNGGVQSQGLKFEHKNQGPKRIGLHTEQLQFEIINGGPGTKLTLQLVTP